MPYTPRGYPYPAPDDRPDAPTDLQRLAAAVDADVQALMQRIAALEAKP